MVSYCLKILCPVLIFLMTACGGGGNSASPDDAAPPTISPDISGSPESPGDSGDSEAPTLPEEPPPQPEPQPPQEPDEAEGIYLVAGSPGTYDHADGTGAQARFTRRMGQLEIDEEDNLYVVDAGTIRKISPSGQVTTLAGMPDEYGYQDGTGEAARFGENIEIAVGPASAVYVLDKPYIRRIRSNGEVTTIVDATEQGIADGPLETARFYDLRSIGVDGEGSIYVEDGTTHWGSFAVRSISSDGVVTTVYTACEDALYRRCFDLEVDAEGTLYYKHQQIPASAGSAATMSAPSSSKVDPEGVVSGVRGYPSGMDALTQVTFADIDRDGNMFVYHVKREGTLYAWYLPWRITRSATYLKKLSPSGEVTIIEPFTRELGETPSPFPNHDGVPVPASGHSSLAVDSKGAIYYVGNGFIGKVVAQH